MMKTIKTEFSLWQNFVLHHSVEQIEDSKAVYKYSVSSLLQTGDWVMTTC